RRQGLGMGPERCVRGAAVEALLAPGEQGIRAVLDLRPTGAGSAWNLARGYRRALGGTPRHWVTSRRSELLAVVPDVRCELPVASDLLPHDEIFAGDVLRPRTFGLKAKSPDLARRGGAKWLDVESREFRIAHLLGHPLPHCLNRGSALHHGGTRREGGCVLGIEGRHAGEITLIEELDPFGVRRLD